MKKNIYLILALLAMNTGFSQSGNLQKDLIDPTSVSHGRPRFVNKAVVWTDNFSNPGTWTATNGVGNSDNWVVGTNPPAGAFPLPVITSTTAANGFGLFDSDLLCSGNQMAYLQSTNAFNFTGQTNVIFSFEQYYRKWTDQVFVEVSNNGGSTWTQYQVNAAFTQNQISATNPEVVNVDISATANNQSNVRIRFAFISNVDNAGEGCDYAWMVDDVSVSSSTTAVPLDLGITKSYSHNIEAEFDYSIIPNSQRRPLVVGCLIQNNSATAATNKLLSVTINDGTSNVYTGSGTFSLASMSNDYIWINTGFTPANNKNYTLSFSLPSDNNATNNTGTAAFKTVDYVYAHDYASTETLGFNISDEVAIGSVYKIYSSTTLYGLDVEFGTGTTPNMPVSINVYVMGNNPQDQSFIASASYTVPASVIGTGNTTTVYFDSPVSLSANETYLVEVRKNAGADRLFIGASPTGNDDYGTVCYGPFGANSAVNWWVNWTKAVAVRMNLYQGCQGFSAFATTQGSPSCNPNLGTATVSITTQGQTVSGLNTISWTGPESGSSPANQANNYEITGLQPGNYTVTVSNNGCTTTVMDVIVDELPSPELSINQVTPVSCYGFSDGSIAYNVNGNSSGYTFTWENGSSSAVRTGLPAGTYTINATDGVCALTESFTLTQPQEINISTVKQNVTTCGGNNGQINITATNGTTQIYNYTWTGPSTGSSGPGFGGSYTLNNLTAGNYTINVTNGVCVNSTVVSISENAAPAITISETDPIACAGGMDGALSLSGTAIAAYTFTWSNGATGTSVFNLGAGTYTVSGTNGTCITVASYELGQPLPLIVSGSASVSTISTTVNGGTPGYTYSWTGPNGFTSTSDNLSNLTTTGVYSLTVTDAHGCTDNQTFDLNYIGVEELAKEGIKFFPNPANEVINFEVNEKVKVIRILDFTGKLVAETNVKNALESVSLQGFANGIYFFNMLDANSKTIAADKFVVNK